MQIVVKDWKDEANLMEINEFTTLKMLMKDLCTKLCVDDSSIELWYNDKCLNDSESFVIESTGIANLGTMTVVKKSSSSTSGDAKEDVLFDSTEGEKDNTTTAAPLRQSSNDIVVDNNSISADVVSSTIVVTEIPISSQEETNAALTKVFSVYGQISKIILQSNEDNESQHAVIIFETDQAADDATQFDGRMLLDGCVNVVLASALGNNSDAGDFVEESSNATSAADKSAARVGALLAKGYCMGEQGASTVKRFDDTHKISMRVKVGAEVAKVKAQQIDEQYGISNKVAATYSSASGKATELNEKYSISKKAQAAAEKASSTANVLSSKAMENETVASGVKKLGSIFSGFKSFSTKAVEEAKVRASVIGDPRGPDFVDNTGGTAAVTSPEAFVASNDKFTVPPTTSASIPDSI